MLNYNSFNNKLPENVSDIYNDKEYLKSQEYKKENFRFNLINSSFSFIILIVVLYNGYFGALDSIVRNYTFENEISPSILFFFSTYFINDFISIPFQLYRVFVIEDKYGFNNMTISTFIYDKLKGYFIIEWFKSKKFINPHNTKKHLHSVKKETWEYLSQKAFNTYVPETTVSRNSGAGAGLLDND